MKPLKFIALLFTTCSLSLACNGTQQYEDATDIGWLRSHVQRHFLVKNHPNTFEIKDEEVVTAVHCKTEEEASQIFTDVNKVWNRFISECERELKTIKNNEGKNEGNIYLTFPSSYKFDCIELPSENPFYANTANKFLLAFETSDSGEEIFLKTFYPIINKDFLKGYQDSFLITYYPRDCYGCKQIKIDNRIWRKSRTNS